MELTRRRPPELPLNPATRTLRFATLVVGLAIGVGAGAIGCGKKGDAPTGAAPSGSPNASASAQTANVVNALPWSAETVAKTINPTGKPVYSGPVGTVRGVVRSKGDPAPALEGVADKIPDRCAGARHVYGRLFREGSAHELADALVTVTGYDVFVPAKADAVKVEARGCAYDRRTVVMTFGQRLEVFSKDSEAYVPKLMGGQMRADMVAVPGSGPVKLYPHTPGRYSVLDQMHLWMMADVFVLKYPTAAVTDLEGKFEIKDVPVGELTVNALLPPTMQVAEKKIKVEADKTVDVELEIAFDQKKHAPAKPEKPKGPVIH